MNESSRGRSGWPVRLAVAVGLAVLLVTAGRSFVKHAIYPIPAIDVGSPPAGYEEIVWSLAGGVEVHGWHGGDPGADRPVMLFFHGNAENLETLKWSGIFDRLAELGVYGVAVEYPGYGRSGGEPSESGLIEGGIAAFDWARVRWPDRPVIVAGWSLGAAVAIQLAAERPEAVDGLVLMSGWTRIFDVASAHFPSFLVRLMLRERYDSVAAAERVRCPSLVVHGSRDSIIPAAQGERLAEALAPRSRWVAVEGSGHNDLLGVARVWAEVTDFVESAI